MPAIQGQTGVLAPTATPNWFMGKSGDGWVSELRSRYATLNSLGLLYSFGLSSTLLANANAIATGVTATAQPILGLFNPSNSGVNCEILTANLTETVIANSAVAPGGFMWMYAAGQGTGITTGSTPINNKTLAASGSACKAFAFSTALTGLVGSLAVLRAFPIGPLNAAGAATAVGIPQAAGYEDVAGSIIVPPGGVVAIMNQLATVTVSFNGSLLWAEIPTTV